VYASTKDRMLTISRLVNHSARAGQKGGETMLATSDLELVDVANGRLAVGGMRSLVDPKHAMRYASSALYDFFAVVRGVAAACRTRDAMVERTGANSWKLTKAPIPVTTPTCGTDAASMRGGAASCANCSG
jgi:hypothetical protein